MSIDRQIALALADPVHVAFVAAAIRCRRSMILALHFIVRPLHYSPYVIPSRLFHVQISDDLT